MTIKLKGTQTQQVEVSVSKSELFDQANKHFGDIDVYLLTKNCLYNKLKLPVSAFIKDGKWFIEEELYSSHSFISKRYLRDVEDGDKVILKVLEDLKEICCE